MSLTQNREGREVFFKQKNSAVILLRSEQKRHELVSWIDEQTLSIWEQDFVNPQKEVKRAKRYQHL